MKVGLEIFFLSFVSSSLEENDKISKDVKCDEFLNAPYNFD